MLTAHWVYISEGENGKIITGISSEIDRNLSVVLARGDRVVYLRSFNEPIDALAHKHLLDYLSKDSVRHLIRKERLKTDVRFSMIKSFIVCQKK